LPCFIRNIIIMLKFICHSFVHDSHIAEDLAQDSFINAIKQIMTFRTELPNSSFKAFIRVIAYNVSLNYLKRQKIKREQSNKVAHGLTDEDTSAEKPPVLAIQNEAKQKLRDALNKLSEPAKTYVWDYYINGLSYSHMCDSYGITKGQLGYELKKGVEMLRWRLSCLEDI